MTKEVARAKLAFMTSSPAHFASLKTIDWCLKKLRGCQ